METELPIETVQSPSNVRTRNKILSSDEEETLAAKEKHENAITSPRKRRKKQIKKLGFSDDEDDDVALNDNLEYKEVDSNEEDDNVAETFIEYDSEENEIEVQLTKEDHLKRAGNFLENEAELSESDWGSADEDEQNLDKYDIELGDEDEFDQRKLQKEVGQIHM